MSNGTKTIIRRILMGGGVCAVLAAGGWMYLTSGRYISTDNAYVKSDVVMISPEVSGKIISVAVKDHQKIQKGDTLFLIDAEPFKIALDRANADLETARTTIEETRAKYRQKEEALRIAETDLTYQSNEYKRQKALNADHYASQSRLDQATRDRNTAEQNISLLKQEQAEILADLNGDPDIAVEDHPKYKAALAIRDQAALDLDHTTVLAPFDGIAGTAVRAGDYARAGTPSMNLVGTSDIWIEANYKETDLTDVKPGQTVKIKIDTYPGREWVGTVDSISPATGGEFSVLPPQNATGNWVKVVQRIPVRIAINDRQVEDALRTGMSTEVTIDTGSYPHLSAQAAKLNHE